MVEKADFIRFFMPLQGDLMAYVLSMGVPPEDADDVLQNSALQVFNKIERFQPGTNFRAWAFAFVKNDLLNYFKSRHRRTLSLSAEASRDIEHLAVTDQEAPSVRLQVLNACLEKLQAFAKSLLSMRYRDGLGVQAIAAKLGRPVDSIYTTMSRVRKALQSCIEGSGALGKGM